MMRLLKYLLLAFPLLAVLSCRKTEVPTPVSTEPVFHLSAVVDGSTVSYRAGENNHSAISGVEANGDYYTYYGGISENGSPALKGEGMMFRFRNTDNATLKTSFDAGNIPFYIKPQTDPITSYSVQLSLEAEGAVSYHWQFSNGMESNEKNPVLELSYEESVTFLEACVTVNFSSGCEISDCDNIYLPHAPCAADFSYSHSEIPSAITFKSEVKSEWPSSFNWDFGTGGTATTSEVRYFYNPTDSITADVVDLHIETNGCTASHRKMVPLTPDPECLVNFDYDVSTTVVEPPMDTIQSGTVEMLWMDASGRLYSTATATQPTEAHFTISEYKEYSDPHYEQEKKSLKAQISFEILLEGNGKIIHMKDGKATIPVGLGYNQL